MLNSERYDSPAAPEMAWNFDVDPGATIEVRIGQGEIFGGNLAVGDRIFAIEIDGAVVEAGIDPFATTGAGIGFVTDYVVTADADGLDVVFLHDVENPNPKSFEIIELAPAQNDPPAFDAPLADASIAETDPYTLTAAATDPEGDVLAYALSGEVPAGMTIDAGSGQIDWTPDLDDSGSYDITVEVSDGVNPAVTDDFTLDVTQTDVGTVLRRINAGGPEVASTDGGPVWSANPNPNTLVELVAGGGSVYGGNTPITAGDVTVPASTPIEVLNSERYDLPAAPEMAWNFDVDPGATIEVRIGQGEIFGGNLAVGDRIFAIEIDGAVVEAGIDPFATTGAGIGFVTDYVVTADADGLDVVFLHDVENPNPKSFEIIELVPAPLNGPPTFDAPLADASIFETDPYTVTAAATDPEGDGLTYAFVGDVPAGMTIDAGTGQIDWTPDFTGSGRYDITVSVTDGVNPPVTDSYQLDVAQKPPPGSALYRVNAGGPAVAAADSSFPDWGADTAANPSPYLVTSNGGVSGGPVNDTTHPTTADTEPDVVYTTERWGSTMSYAFPVAAGTEVEVRILLNETYAPAQVPGGRQFDVVIDGVVVAPAVEPFAAGGGNVASIVDAVVVSDGQIDLSFNAIADNPAIKGIEILGVSGVPVIEILDGLDGSTIQSDSFTVSWRYDGFIDPNDHVHFKLDGLPVTTPPNDQTVNTGGTHNTLIRPTTSIDLTGVAGGSHTVTVQVADTGHVEYTNPESLASANFDVDLTPPADPLVVDKWVSGVPVYRVNAGGGLITAIDGGPDWAANTNSDLPGFLDPDYAASDVSELATTAGAVITPDGTIPASTPGDIFVTERYDPPPGIEMGWNFPATTGNPYEVRLYFADSYSGTQSVGARVFDVSIDDELVLDDFDIFAVTGPTTNIGTMRRFVVVADGDGIDIDFDRMVENPTIRGIEIVPLETATTGSSGADYDYVTRITNPASNTQVATLTALTDTVNGGTAVDISAGCETALGALAADESLVCRFSSTHTGAGGATFDDVVDVTGTFSGGGSADTSSNTVTVTISTNVDPVLDPVADQAVFPGELIDIAFNATDTDVGDTLTLSLSSVPALPAGAVFDDGAGTGFGGLTWTPDPTDTGIYAVTLTVNDGNGGIANQPFQILVGESLPLLINAGAGAAPTGWVSDVGYRAGGNTAAGADPIDLTDPSLVDTPAVEAMLQTESWGPQTWTALVPDGTYEVRLYFAETFNGLANQDARFFDVAIEGTQVLDDFKPWAEAGAPDKGVARSFVVEVTDGNGVGIELINQTGGDNAAIKGVEIREVVLQANAGAGAVGTWDAADGLVTGGTPFGTGATIALDPTAPLTTPQAVLQNELYGDPVTWAIPVEDATSYEVRLYLVETFQTATGLREFDVTIEALPWLTAYEMLDDVVKDALVIKRYFLTSTDTVLDIVMDATVDNASVKGVEIIAN